MSKKKPPKKPECSKIWKAYTDEKRNSIRSHVFPKVFTMIDPKNPKQLKTSEKLDYFIVNYISDLNDKNVINFTINAREARALYKNIDFEAYQLLRESLDLEQVEEKKEQHVQPSINQISRGQKRRRKRKRNSSPIPDVVEDTPVEHFSPVAFDENYNDDDFLDPDDPCTPPTKRQKCDHVTPIIVNQKALSSDGIEVGCYRDDKVDLQTGEISNVKKCFIAFPTKMTYLIDPDTKKVKRRKSSVSQHILEEKVESVSNGKFSFKHLYTAKDRDPVSTITPSFKESEIVSFHMNDIFHIDQNEVVSERRGAFECDESDGVKVYYIELTRNPDKQQSRAK